MKEDSFTKIGIDIVLFVAGLAGAIVSLTKNNKMNTFERFIVVFSGGLSANYLTPLTAEWFNLSEKTLYGLAFLIGYGGLKTVEAFIMKLHSINRHSDAPTE
jgi:dihydroorotate dehydrogenase